MIHNFLRQTIITTLFIILLSSSALAIETITITRGRSDPTPIAINYFDFETTQENFLSDNLISVIGNDLQNSGLFKNISKAAFIEHVKGISHKPLFIAWRQINANLLVNGSVKILSNKNIKISFIVWDTILEKQLIAEEFIVANNLWRRVAHKIADKIYEKITGDKGYFDTQIAYVSESGTYLKRLKRIAIMDQDGANHQYLTDGKNLVLTPRFSHDNSKIMYISYAKKIPRVYMRDLRTGRDRIVGDFPGMSFAPRFASSGNHAVMSIAKNGATHIYSVDLRSMRIKQLTFGASINTSPSFSPDDSKIVFNSDRGGSRQLYIMNADGSNINRISFAGNTYATPCWSPRGDYIAFTKITRAEGFTIGVMRPTADPTANGERIIAKGYLVEGPTWAPSGRVIMFTKAGPSRGNTPGRSKIYSIDVTGYNEREIPTSQDASDPDWSNP